MSSLRVWAPVSVALGTAWNAGGACAPAGTEMAIVATVSVPSVVAGMEKVAVVATVNVSSVVAGCIMPSPGLLPWYLVLPKWSRSMRLGTLSWRSCRATGPNLEGTPMRSMMGQCSRHASINVQWFSSGRERPTWAYQSISLTRKSWCFHSVRECSGVSYLRPPCSKCGREPRGSEWIFCGGCAAVLRVGGEVVRISFSFFAPFAAAAERRCLRRRRTRISRISRCSTWTARPVATPPSATPSHMPCQITSGTQNFRHRSFRAGRAVA